MVYKQSLQEWIDSFQTADIHTTDRHITDFSKQEISKKEWIKKGFLIAESCIEYIRSTDYRIFVYIGFALKKMKKAILPPTYSAKAYKEKYSIGNIKIKDYIFQMSILL